MKHKIWGFTAFFICCLLVFVARHHPPSRRKIKEIWHGRVFWERESNTTMLRSSADIFVSSDSSLGWLPTWIVGNSSIVITAPSTRNAQTWTTGSIKTDMNGVSGVVFSGKQIRKYDGKRLYQNGKTEKADPSLYKRLSERLKTSRNLVECRKWVVSTTIFLPGEMIRRTTSRNMVSEGWCVLIVADKKTPSRDAFPENIVYLSVEEQIKWGSLLESIKLIPFNHYGRKNIGYLFAILQGAEAIFDTDDDNLLSNMGTVIPIRNLTSPEHVTVSGTRHTHVFNPYPYFGWKDSWPRGFPLSKITNEDTKHFWQPYFVPEADEAFTIQQSLANGDPDVDAIFRLTKPNIKNIWPEDAWPVYPPAGVLTPFNGQATVYLPDAFWSLWLPISIHSRVSDIWRSYWCQRIMWDAGQRVLFVPPFIQHDRTSHVFIKDYAAESQIYMQADILTKLLPRWNSLEDDFGYPLLTLDARAEALGIWMYERGFFELQDVHFLQAWLTDLHTIGYTFPKVNPSLSEGGSYINGRPIGFTKPENHRGCVVTLIDENHLAELSKYSYDHSIFGIINAPFIGSTEIPLFIFCQAAGLKKLQHILTNNLAHWRSLNIHILTIDGYHYDSIAATSTNREFLPGDSNVGYHWCSQFLALDMYSHPALLPFKYMWRIDQDVTFYPCEPGHKYNFKDCIRLLKSGPFEDMYYQNISVLNDQMGAYSHEHPYAVKGLVEAVTSFITSRPDLFTPGNETSPVSLNSLENALDIISHWKKSRRLVAGFSEVVDLSIFRAKAYTDYLRHIRAIDLMIWDVPKKLTNQKPYYTWREQSFKSLWVWITVPSGHISQGWYPTVKHKKVWK